jgi:hypothetical protein
MLMMVPFFLSHIEWFITAWVVNMTPLMLVPDI